jgi:hypothetical protein
LRDIFKNKNIIENRKFKEGTDSSDFCWDEKISSKIKAAETDSCISQFCTSAISIW